jgi:hypothetical protein
MPKERLTLDINPAARAYEGPVALSRHGNSFDVVVGTDGRTVEGLVAGMLGLDLIRGAGRPVRARITVERLED